MIAGQEAVVRNQVVAIEQPRFITVREVSGIAGFSKSSILRKIAAGEFPRPVIQEGNVTRWDFAEVMRWRTEQFKKRDQRFTLAAEAHST